MWIAFLTVWGVGNKNANWLCRPFVDRGLIFKPIQFFILLNLLNILSLKGQCHKNCFQTETVR